MFTKDLSLKALVLLLVSGLLFTACKNDPVEPEPDPTPFQLSLASQSAAFMVADNLSNTSDPNALLTTAYVSALQGAFLGYSNFLLVPAAAVGDGSGSWTWGDGLGNTITYLWTESSSENCVRVSLSGPQVDNGLYYEACEKKDGSGGWMKIYDPSISNALVSEFIWTYTGTDAGTFELKDYENNSRQIVTFAADGSGTLKLYEDNILTYSSIWNADGSGSFKEYDSQGNLTNEGAWS